MEWVRSARGGEPNASPLKLGANLSVQVPRGKTKIHPTKALRFDGHLSKQLGHLLLGSEDSTLGTSLNLGVTAANRGLKQGTMFSRKSLKALYMLPAFPDGGGKDPDRATRKHIHTFAACLIPPNKNVWHLFCPLFCGAIFFFGPF